MGAAEQLGEVELEAFSAMRNPPCPIVRRPRICCETTCLSGHFCYQKSSLLKTYGILTLTLERLSLFFQ
jgi:hypothetical protein